MLWWIGDWYTCSSRGIGGFAGARIGGVIRHREKAWVHFRLDLMSLTKQICLLDIPLEDVFAAVGRQQGSRFQYGQRPISHSEAECAFS